MHDNGYVAVIELGEIASLVGCSSNTSSPMTVVHTCHLPVVLSCHIHLLVLPYLGYALI